MRWKLTIYTAWHGDPRHAEVERVLTYRWHWQAKLRSIASSSIGPDVRIARWCEITKGKGEDFE